MRHCLAALMLLATGVIHADFKPEVVSVNLSHKRFRPGDMATITITYKNAGTKAASAQFRGFMHIESTELQCEKIIAHLDHELGDPPTTLWEPGDTVVVGPIMVYVPPKTPDGEYRLHFGIFDYQGTEGRYVDYDAGTVTIDKNAPKITLEPPPPLPNNIASERLNTLKQKLDNAKLKIETDELTFRLADDASAFDLLDKRGGAFWTSNPEAKAFGYINWIEGDKNNLTQLLPFTSIAQTSPTQITLAKLVKPDLIVNVTIRTVDEAPKGLAFDVECIGNHKQVKRVLLFHKAFQTTNNESGASTVGFRTGERFDTLRSKSPGTRSWPTYNGGSTMAMIGQEKEGCGLLLSWDHPHTQTEFARNWKLDSRILPGTVVHSFSFTSLQADKTTCYVRPLGKANYVDIAKAYRSIVRKSGLAMTWAEKKAKLGIDVEKMHGAADFKPFVFSRTVPESVYNRSGKLEQWVAYSMPEIAQCAEHLHNDLKIDRAMMVLAGWIHRGYDNQHPDPLPVAPELGGNEALIKASKRIKDTGFLFGLHDNYQDMYKDAPSWNPDMIAKNANGTLRLGGNWAGGQCWLVCAEKQVELARRPETNLPMIQKLFRPTIYFIDTIFAAPLYDCHDPNHPQTRYDDMIWKSKLCELARKHFGLFGSEEGREWAVPYADYFEGVFSHRANIRNRESKFFSHMGGDLVPIMEMVYGDCVNLYTHQSDRATPGRDDYILACISHAETPLYHFGPHIYFSQQSLEGEYAFQLLKPTVKSLGNRKFSVAFQWKVLEPVSFNVNSFVHFIHETATNRPDKIAFQDDHPIIREPVKPGQIITSTREITVPEGYDNDIIWKVGLFDAKTGRRLTFTGFNNQASSNFKVADLAVNKDQTIKVDFVKENPQESNFARADNGWAKHLNLTDRFIKNTYEVTSWIARLSANSPMTNHRFLDDDKDVEFTEFGTMSIYVNQSTKPFALELPQLSKDTIILPPAGGFLAYSPTFLAFHASSFNGHKYDSPVLFTFRSLDGQPLQTSKQLRVFHGFGDENTTLFNKPIAVETEAILNF